MISADLIREARLRSGLTQAELGRRVSRPQSAIARWESGRVTPSLETLRDVIRACGLELWFHLYNYDDSYLPVIERNLRRSPADRIRHMADIAQKFQPLKDAVLKARDA